VKEYFKEHDVFLEEIFFIFAGVISVLLIFNQLKVRIILMIL